MMFPTGRLPTSVIPSTSRLTILSTLGAFSLLAPLAAPAAAQVPARQWTSFYQGPAAGFDAGTAVAADSAGNTYVGGNSATSAVGGVRPAVVKYSTDGTTLWSQRLGVSEQDIDQLISLHLAPDGGVIVGGFRAGPGPGGSFNPGDYFIARLNPSTGIPDWTRYISGAGNNSDALRDLAIDAAGNIYATGESFTGTDLDILTIKLDSAGNVVWRATTNGPAGGPMGINDSGAAIAVDPAGNVFVTGSLQTGYDTTLDDNIYQPVTIKFSPDGAQLWSALMPAQGFGVGIVLVPNGDGRFAPVSSANTSGINRTARYSADGAQQWLTPYSGPSNISGATAYTRALVLPDGNIVIGGSVCKNSSGACAESAGLWILSVATGSITQTFDFRESDSQTLLTTLRAIAVDSSGIIYGGGLSTFSNPVPELQRALVFAFDPMTNAARWIDSSSPPGSFLTNIAALAVNTAGPSAGGIVAVGSRSVDATGSTFLTTQYAAAASTCPADFNADGVLNADDLGDFITGYFNDPPDSRCDFNIDTVINADDLGDFITAYFNGC